MVWPMDNDPFVNWLTYHKGVSLQSIVEQSFCFRSGVLPSALLIRYGGYETLRRSPERSRARGRARARGVHGLYRRGGLRPPLHGVRAAGGVARRSPRAAGGHTPRAWGGAWAALAPPGVRACARAPPRLPRG